MNLSAQKWILLGGALLLTSAGVYASFFKDPVLAQVGSTKIYLSDAQYRDQMIRLSFPEEKRSMGLYQLIQSAYNFEVLKNNSAEIQDPQLDLEEARINNNSKNPEQLKKIKSIFGEDLKAYRRAFLRPTLADRMIYYDFFLTNPELHKDSAVKAREIIQLAKTHEKDLKQIASERRLPYQKLKISLKGGVIPDGQKIFRGKGGRSMAEPGHGDEEEATQWYEMVLKDLPAGAVAPAPVDRGEAWMVVRCLTKTSLPNFEAKVETITVPKMDFHEWFEKEKAKISVEIYDKSRPVP